LEDAGSAIRFNLSHSDDLMLLAVTYAREIGVDLEFMRGNVPFETLADHYFDPEDAWDLRNLPATQRAWKFYDVWTCTEARLKAHGVGLANGFQVVEPDRWSLLKLTPAAGYTAALAVEGGDFELGCWSWQK
jgi:4'-phosphopantetheinyl transferase